MAEWGTGKTIAVLAVVAILFVFLAALFSFISGGMPSTVGGKCVEVIEISGDITYSGEQVSLFGFAPGAREMISQMEAADEDDGVGAMMVEINSPGGSAAASKELFDALISTKKPSVAYLAEAAASGGYYVAAAADHIVANPNTITGSIGARTTLFNYEGLLEKLGLREESVKSGRLKDIGAPYRNVTEEERRILQAIISELAGNFRADVETARGSRLHPALFAQALDARILTATQARDAGLVDEIGGRKRALQKAAVLGGNNEMPECVHEQTFSLIDLFTTLGSGFARGALAELRTSKTVAEFR